MDSVFSSNKPYLFRAIYEWLLDNGATPYILVDATQAGVSVPTEHIKDGQIVLNIDPNAISNWRADNEWISFSARFAGVARTIEVPINALLAIYAQENGLGMAFPIHEQQSTESDLESSDNLEAEAEEKSVKNKKDEKKASHLKIVK